jgi:hypothetical protein
MIPLLLSGKKVEGDYALRFGLLGMWLSENKGDVKTKSQLLPFYTWKRDSYMYTPIYGQNRFMKYYLTPIAGSYAGERSGSWVWPLYLHRKEPDGSVDGSYLLLGSYSKGESERHHRFWGVYSYRDREYSVPWNETDCEITRSKDLSYLLLGYDNDTHIYEKTAEGGRGEQLRRRENKGFFPFYSSRDQEDYTKGEQEKTSSLLLALYDRREEKREDHEYLRRRILWRIWHYEKLNGDVSTDIFPGITHDAYKNGYRKISVWWRLFRYENDPETGKKEMDLFFIPVKR